MASQHQALRPRQKKKRYGSMDTRVEIKEPESHSVEKKKLNEINDCGEFCEWLQIDTWNKLKFLYFFISILILLLISFYYFLMEEYKSGYIVAGIYGILLCLYGFNHFRLLFKLKEEIDLFEKQNHRFRKERNSLNIDVDKLKNGRNALKSTHKKLENSNLKMIDMIRKLESLEDELNAINIKSNNELSQIGNKANHLRSKYYDISLTQQKNILWKLFDRLTLFKKQKEDKGIFTKNDYDIFYSLLTKEYQQRFDRLGGFESLLKISDDDKNYIDSKDFQKALDVYAKMHVENVDIKFKINTIKTKQKTEQQPKYERKITILKETKRSGFYLTKQDIWNAANGDDGDNKSNDSRSPSPLLQEPILMHQNRINL